VTAEPPVSIRPAEAVDAEDIAAVILSAFEPYRGRIEPTPSALSETGESIGRRLASGPGFVAEARDRVVGCVLTAFNSPGELYVGRLAVVPEWRRRGLGRRLIARSEELARERGCAAISLGVRIALKENIAFFERLGFRFVSEERHPGYSRPTYIAMAKLL
jgi:ribosomal protein S18 acetylase RimI-like enzyme